MIGSTDTKMAYFDKGLVETLVPILSSIDASGRLELTNEIRFEIITILNSFLHGDCPAKMLDTFALFKAQLAEAMLAALNVV